MGNYRLSLIFTVHHVILPLITIHLFRWYWVAYLWGIELSIKTLAMVQGNKYKDSIGRVFNVINIDGNTITLNRLSERLSGEYIGKTNTLLSLPLNLFIKDINKTWFALQ